VEPARRFLFWAVFLGGDPDRPISLLRYDRWVQQPATPRHSGPPRGAVLRAPSPPFGGSWRPSELPDRTVLLGFGYEPWIIDERTVFG
jgi:hypothetical protein